jgi:hypothetical protein
MGESKEKACLCQEQSSLLLEVQLRLLAEEGFCGIKKQALRFA